MMKALLERLPQQGTATTSKRVLEEMNNSASTNTTVDMDDDDDITNASCTNEDDALEEDGDHSCDKEDNIYDNQRRLKPATSLDQLHEMRDELERMRLLKLRQELEALKLKGKIKERQRQHELQQVQIKLQMAQTKLQEQLMERTHHAMYMKFLTCEYQDYEQRKAAPLVVSTTVLQCETPLLSIMYRAFLVLPKQMELTKKLYQRQINKYLKQQIRLLEKENDQVSQDVVQKLSLKAEENDQLYEAYQIQVQEQVQEIRKLKLLKQRNSNKTRGDPLKSNSEHSATSYTEDFESSSSSFWENPIPVILPLLEQNR